MPVAVQLLLASAIHSPQPSRPVCQVRYQVLPPPLCPAQLPASLLLSFQACPLLLYRPRYPVLAHLVSQVSHPALLQLLFLAYPPLLLQATCQRSFHQSVPVATPLWSQVLPPLSYHPSAQVWHPLKSQVYLQVKLLRSFPVLLQASSPVSVHPMFHHPTQALLLLNSRRQLGVNLPHSCQVRHPARLQPRHLVWNLANCQQHVQVLVQPLYQVPPHRELQVLNLVRVHPFCPP